jgi:hypothetical protein
MALGATSSHPSQSQITGLIGLERRAAFPRPAGSAALAAGVAELDARHRTLQP